jgi:hypothetical protein
LACWAAISRAERSCQIVARAHRQPVGSDGDAHRPLEAAIGEIRLAIAGADDDQLARLVSGDQKRDVRVL